MKNTFLVVTTNKNRLRRHGEIVYESKLTNLVGLETNKSLKRIQKVDGVISVEEARTGSFCA